MLQAVSEVVASFMAEEVHGLTDPRFKPSAKTRRARLWPLLYLSAIARRGGPHFWLIELPGDSLEIEEYKLLIIPVLERHNAHLSRCSHKVLFLLLHPCAGHSS